MASIARLRRIKQGAQVGFVYLFLYGLLFGYVTWTLEYGCGPSIFTAAFSGFFVLYTFYYLVLNFLHRIISCYLYYIRFIILLLTLPTSQHPIVAVMFLFSKCRT